MLNFLSLSRGSYHIALVEMALCVGVPLISILCSYLQDIMEESYHFSVVKVPFTETLMKAGNCSKQISLKNTKQTRELLDLVLILNLGEMSVALKSVFREE